MATTTPTSISLSNSCLFVVVRNAQWRTSRLIALLLSFSVFACISTPVANSQQVALNKQQLAAQVRSEFLHAWSGYKKYAWGHDDLNPLSKTYHDWYAQSLLMTPVDALDTMILMGLTDEADNTKKCQRH